jgi:hypothetical protein
MLQSYLLGFEVHSPRGFLVNSVYIPSLYHFNHIPNHGLRGSTILTTLGGLHKSWSSLLCNNNLNCPLISFFLGQKNALDNSF